MIMCAGAQQCYVEAGWNASFQMHVDSLKIERMHVYIVQTQN